MDVMEGNLRRSPGILLIAAILAACGGDSPRADAEPAPRGTPVPGAASESSPPPTPETDPRRIAWAPSLEIDLDAMERQATGLYVQVLADGEGPRAAPGDTMGIHYTVWLADGRKLDSSFDHTPPGPYGIILGETPLIEGWVEGVTGMRLGEKRRLVVPYDLAYGAAGRPGVPPYSALVFEVELARHAPAAPS